MIGDLDFGPFIRLLVTCADLFWLMYTPKNYDLFKVVENSMQQCCAAHIVHSCQQYCSALLSLNQPAIRLNNAEQVVDNYEQYGQHNIVASCFQQP